MPAPAEQSAPAWGLQLPGSGFGAMWWACRQRPATALTATVTGVVNGATMVLGAAVIGWATDRLIVPALTGGQVAGAVWWTAAAAILAVSTLRWCTILIRGLATGLVQAEAGALTRRRVLGRYLDLDPLWHRARHRGRLLSTAVSDVEVLWAPVQWLYFAFGMVVMLGIALVQITGRQRWLGLIAAGMVFAVLAVSVLYQRRLTVPTRRLQAERGAFAAVALENIQGSQVIRTLGIAGAETRRVAVQADRLRAATTSVGRVSAFFEPLLELLPTLTVLLVLAVGAPAVRSGGLSVGVLVEVIYLLLTVVIPLNVISRFLGLLPLSAAGAERVGEVLTAPVGITYGTRELTGTGAAGLELRSVGVRHGDHEVLRGVDLQVRPGEVLALVGATGAGKSTLLEVLARQLQPSSGTVLLDGVPLTELAPGRAEAAVVLVPQTAWLFHGSIRENLMLADGLGGLLDEADLWAALAAARAEDVVHALPHGLDTLAGEQGARLSGGQRQRLCLARALLQRPRVLLLDDATSALDPEVENEVLASIAALGGDCTVVIAAGRLNAIRLADRVAHLDDGRLAVVGSHAELLAGSPGYRDIVHAYGGAGD